MTGASVLMTGASVLRLVPQCWTGASVDGASLMTGASVLRLVPQ